MDGNKPECSSDLKATEPRTIGLGLRSLPISSTSLSDQFRKGLPERLPHRSDSSLSKPAIPFSSPPIADWKLFANLSLPGENAVYSLHDGNGRFLEATDGCQRLWKASTEEIQGQDIADFLLPRTSLLNWLLAIDADSQRSTFSATSLVKGQTYLPVELKRIPLFISPDPKQSRIVLKSVVAEATLPQPLPEALTLVSVHSHDGTFTEANASWIHCLGFLQKEMLGRNLADFAHPLDRPAAKQFLAELNAIDSSSRCLLRFVDSLGQQKSLLIEGNRIPGGNYLSLNAKDMTLDRENPGSNLLKFGAELVRESIVMLSKSPSGFPICYANRAFEILTGFTVSHVSGQELSCLNGSKTDPETILKINSALNDNRAVSIELLLYRKNGDPFWCKANFFPLRDSTGKTHYFAAVIEDVTRERELANELEERNRELSQTLATLEETQNTVIQQENLRALGQMASGIAHDFNNLLTPILGFSELLLNMPAESRDNDKLESFLKKIQVAAQDGAAVVSRLREFYQAHNDEDEIFSVINPEILLGQLKDLTEHRWKIQAEGRGANIRFETDIRTARCIRGNESELRQSLANLVINAVDAIKTGGTITVSVKDLKDRVSIEVKDTGEGMPDNIQDKCLDAFYTTKGQLGTGLGLSIVSGIVKRHGGEITIDSKVGEGTVITMNFPAVEADFTKETLTPLPAELAPLHIMLIDDEAILLEVISELLESGGHIVSCFTDPELAIKDFSHKSYDLVIADRAMPSMSGDQLAAKIKALKPDITVYLMTGFGDFIEGTGENPDNIDAVLNKPVPLDTLNRKLAEMISSKTT